MHALTTAAVEVSVIKGNGTNDSTSRYYINRKFNSTGPNNLKPLNGIEDMSKLLRELKIKEPINQDPGTKNNGADRYRVYIKRKLRTSKHSKNPKNSHKENATRIFVQSHQNQEKYLPAADNSVNYQRISIGKPIILYSKAKMVSPYTVRNEKSHEKHTEQEADLRWRGEESGETSRIALEDEKEELYEDETQETRLSHKGATSMETEVTNDSIPIDGEFYGSEKDFNINENINEHSQESEEEAEKDLSNIETYISSQGPESSHEQDNILHDLSLFTGNSETLAPGSSDIDDYIQSEIDYTSGTQIPLHHTSDSKTYFDSNLSGQFSDTMRNKLKAGSHESKWTELYEGNEEEPLHRKLLSKERYMSSSGLVKAVDDDDDEEEYLPQNEQHVNNIHDYIDNVQTRLSVDNINQGQINFPSDLTIQKQNNSAKPNLLNEEQIFIPNDQFDQEQRDIPVSINGELKPALTADIDEKPYDHNNHEDLQEQQHADSDPIRNRNMGRINLSAEQTVQENVGTFNKNIDHKQTNAFLNLDGAQAFSADIHQGKPHTVSGIIDNGEMKWIGLSSAQILKKNIDTFREKKYPEPEIFVTHINHPDVLVTHINEAPSSNIAQEESSYNFADQGVAEVTPANIAQERPHVIFDPFNDRNKEWTDLSSIQTFKENPYTYNENINPKQTQVHSAHIKGEHKCVPCGNIPQKQSSHDPFNDFHTECTDLSSTQTFKGNNYAYNENINSEQTQVFPAYNKGHQKYDSLGNIPQEESFYDLVNQEVIKVPSSEIHQEQPHTVSDPVDSENVEWPDISSTKLVKEQTYFPSNHIYHKQVHILPIHMNQETHTLPEPYNTENIQNPKVKDYKINTFHHTEEVYLPNKHLFALNNLRELINRLQIRLRTDNSIQLSSFYKMIKLIFFVFKSQMIEDNSEYSMWLRQLNPVGIDTEDNKAQLKTNDSNAEKLSKEETRLVGHEMIKGDNSTKILSSSKEHKREENESVATAEREVTRNGDQSRNNEGSERRSFETPEILVKGYPQNFFESNGGECFSPLSVKNIVKNVLEYVKKQPDALDLIINDIKSESEEKAESSKIQNDPTHDELRSLPKPLLEYKLFDTNNGCPLSIIRFLKQIPKFLSQLRKHPQCLFPIFGCNEFKVQSTSSHFCENLHFILNVYEIPRPVSRPIHEFVSPAPEVSSEIMESEVQIPFYFQELNESQSEPGVKPYNMVPQYLPQEQPSFPKYIPNEIIITPEFTPQFEILPHKQVRPQQEEMQTDVIKSPPLNIQLDIFDTEIHKANIEEDISTYVQEPIYNRYPKPIPIEEIEPPYVENFEPVYVDESKPVNKPFYFKESKPIYIKDTALINIKKPELVHFKEPVYVGEPTYIEEHKPIYIDQPESMYIEESRPIYLEEPEPTYVKDFKHKIKPIYIEEPKPFYVEQPKSDVKPIYIAASKPAYVEELNLISKEKLKPVTSIPIYINKPESIYVQEPEFTYIEESKPHVEPSYNEKLKKLYFQDTGPLYTETLEFINPEESKPAFEPIYTEESRPIYEEKAEPVYVEEIKPSINPMFINEPAPVYVEKLNPMSDYESNHQKPIHIYDKEPKPITIKEPGPIYMEKIGPVNKPNYFEEPKSIYNQYPVYFEESIPNYEIESSPTYEEGFKLDVVKEIPKPIYVKHPELIYVKELKAGSKPIVIDEPTSIYVKEPQTKSDLEPESMYIEEGGPVNNPFYFKEPKQIYSQYPVHFEESTPNYEIESSSRYEEAFNQDDVKEKPKSIYVEHPELFYVEELKPGNKPIVIDGPTPIYVEKQNPISIDKSKYQKPLSSHVNEPEPIAIQEPEPIYTDERRPVTKPNYFGEPKVIYNHYPEYLEESTPNYKIESNPTYIEALNPDDVKERPKAIYVEHPKLIYTEELNPRIEPFYLNGPKLIYVEDSKTNNIKKVVPVKKPGVIDNFEPTYINNKQNPMIEIQPVYVEDTILTHEKEYNNEEPITIIIKEPESNYSDKPVFIENPKPIPINNPETVSVEASEIIYTDEIEPEPTYVEKERDYIEADIYFEQSIPESISKPQPIHVEESRPVNEKETNVAHNVDLKHDLFKVKPKLVAVEQPEPMYMEKPVPAYFEEFNTYFENPKHLYFQEQDTIYPEEPELFSNDQLTHIVDSKPVYVAEPEITYIEKPINIEQIEVIHTPETPKEQPTQQVYAQILPSNVVEQIIQLITDNPKKHVNNIIKVLQENQQVIKPQLYKILFSVLNAFIKGIVDSERFNEIVTYLIKPRINSEWNNKKTQTLYYLLSPGKTGQVEVSTLDIIYGLIHQPENTSNSPQMLDLIFSLLTKIKTEHVDHRINDIILALLNRNKNNIFSDKEVEILLTFIQPNKMGYVPKKRIDIASMLVNFDKIPYFSQNNLKTIFLLMERNKIGKIDPRAIQILKEILLPKKLSFLSEQNIIYLLEFLRTDSGEFIHPKRLEVALFLLKNKPQAPNLIDCLIKSLKEYDILHSKFIDILLYLHKKNMLAYNLLETLVSLLSQENSGHIDTKTLNNLFLLLAPYKNSKPKVVFDVYHILNREPFPTPNMDTSTTHHNIKVLMYYLMNSGKQFDQSLNPGYNQLELKNLLSKVFQKPEWTQNNEFVPESLEHNNGYVELTYLLKDHEPVLYHPAYYVKYNIPMTIFLKNIQDILASDSEVINDPQKLLLELTLAGSVSEVSSNLNGFRKEDILKLTFEDGKLIQTKVLHEKNLNLNDQIKQIQDFNSNTSPQEILQQNNINAAKYYITYRGKPSNLAGTGSVVHRGNIGGINGQRPIVMSLNKSYLREIKTDEPKRTNTSLPLNDQRISTQSLLIGLEDEKNKTERYQENEN
ncbi:unnamed protein product [Arctia plantaginis]|uniref:Uncharacterized protein n=1 Tax=Arctia plantaginis TaxID=874455 RepID=A0A8S1AAY0_ARCPL|nr:unnamed protein product [Arctia plantaginis]